MAKLTITPGTEYLRQFSEKIDKGIYAIPVFQRNFVWRESQVLELFDSIYRGYPIGTILLWKPNEDYIGISKDILTDEHLDSPKCDYYVLDGRQRLTTFYGCVSSREDKPSIFCLGYNLKDQCFQYLGKKEKSYIVDLSQIYDTFSLLSKMGELRHDKDLLPSQANVYISRAKELNAILQSYVAGEIRLDNCSIDEAGKVFTRINSTGTDISKASMLQAVYYQKENDVLITEELGSIIESLSIYGFSGISENDLLNMLYMYVGKHYYDDFDIEAFQRADMKQALDGLRQDISQAVRFLHDDCHVLSYKLLPYMRQLDNLVAFFKENHSPSDQQLEELKRWFFFTSCQQFYQNSSLAIVRRQFARFQEFIDGNNNTAFDDKAIETGQAFDFKFSLRAAKSDILAITMIERYAGTNQDESIDYLGQIKLNGNDPAGVFLYLKHEDKDIIDRMIKGGSISVKQMASLVVDEEIVSLIQSGRISEACGKRQTLLIEAGREMLTKIGLEVK